MKMAFDEFDADQLLMLVIEAHGGIWIRSHGIYGRFRSGLDELVPADPDTADEVTRRIELDWRQRFVGELNLSHLGLHVHHVRTSLGGRPAVVISKQAQPSQEDMVAAWRALDWHRAQTMDKSKAIRWIKYLGDDQIDLGWSDDWHPQDPGLLNSQLELYALGLENSSLFGKLTSAREMRELTYNGLLRLLIEIFEDREQTIRKLIDNHGGSEALIERLLEKISALGIRQGAGWS